MKRKLISFAICLALIPASYADADAKKAADDAAFFEETGFDADFYEDFYGDEEMIEISTGILTQVHRAPSVASIFTARHIKQMGATDIDDVLETVPGLHISRNATNYNPIYSFRGVHTSFNSQVLMLVNGIPITNNLAGDRNQVWGGMPVEAISRIEVIRGPGSALYGADAFSGVINIVTKDANELRDTELAIRSGTNNTQDAWFSYGNHENEVKYAAVLEYHKTDGFDQFIEADLQTLLDAVAGTNVSLAPGKLSLGTENVDFRGEVEYENFLLRAGYQLRNNVGTGAGLAEALDPDARQKSERFNIDANFNHRFDNGVLLDVQASAFNTSQEIKNQYTIFPVGSDAGTGFIYPNGFIGNPEVWEKQQRMNATFKYNNIDWHKISVGIGYYYSDLYRTSETKNFGLGADGNVIIPGSPLQDVSDTPYIFLQETDRKNKYLFVQDVWNVSNDWELTAGLRYDDYSDFGSTVNPRLALVWATSFDVTTKLLYGQAFRAPSFAERGNINNPVALGNPAIKPEKMETVELVIDHHPIQGVGFVLNFYHYTWDDIIQFVPDEGLSTSTAQNAGKQSAYGSEFELTWEIVRDLEFTANYAFSKAKNDTTNVTTAFVPEHQWFAQLDWEINDEFRTHIRTQRIQDRVRNTGDLREKIDDYWLTDFTFRWNDYRLPFDLAFIAKNIFDADAREPSINNGPVVNLPNDLPLGERRLLAELRYQF